jgi:hypothetical protein
MVLAELRALIGTPEFAGTAYTNAKASLEASAEDWASDVAVRLTETKANSFPINRCSGRSRYLPSSNRDGRDKCG